MRSSISNSLFYHAASLCENGPCTRYLAWGCQQQGPTDNGAVPLGTDGPAATGEAELSNINNCWKRVESQSVYPLVSVRKYFIELTEGIFEVGYDR